jgi:hypothetical protein
MKKHLLLAAVAATMFTGVASAQSVYGGVGLPGIYNLGYRHDINKYLGFRGQYAAGLDYTTNGVQEGVQAKVNIMSKEVGLFADVHPFGGAFRIVGGVTKNTLQATVNAVGSGTAEFNGKTVNMTGETYNVLVKFPDTTPYLGIGWGHSAESKGFGLYLDLGVKFGKFTVTSDTSLVASGKVTQADVDAQDQKMKETVGGVNYMPVFQMGMRYSW